MGKVIGYTRHPLQLVFRVGSGPLFSHVSLQCAVTGATNYDILVGQQALYPLGFGVDNWIEEAWIQPGWFAGDSRKELIHRTHEIVHTLDAPPLSIDSAIPLLARTIQWRPPDEGITLVELFAGIGTGLAAVLEAGLKVRRYVHVDNGFAANRAARHHMQRLLALYLEQLPPSAIRGCFGKLPWNVTLVSEDDLR